MVLRRDQEGYPLCSCGTRLEKPETEMTSTFGGEFDDLVEAEYVHAEPLMVQCRGCGKMWRLQESAWPMVTIIG